jgi:hypothetical protein
VTRRSRSTFGPTTAIGRRRAECRERDPAQHGTAVIQPAGGSVRAGEWVRGRDSFTYAVGQSRGLRRRGRAHRRHIR